MGINVKKAMAWCDQTMTAQAKGLAIPPPTHPPQPRGRFAGGPHNMKKMHSGMWYARDLLGHRTTSLIDQHRELMLISLDQEDEIHAGEEPNTPSHAQIQIAAFAVPLWATTVASRPSKTDLEIQRRLIDWLRFDWHIWDLCRDAEGIWTPGARAQNKKGELIGDNWARDLADLAIRELPFEIPGKEQQYAVGARALAALPSEIKQEIRRPPDVFPPMIAPFHILRWTGQDGAPLEHIAWFEEPFLKPKEKPVAAAGSSPLLGRWIVEHSTDLNPMSLEHPEVPPNRSLDIPRAELPERRPR